jgi:hypothetical protein
MKANITISEDNIGLFKEMIERLKADVSANLNDQIEILEEKLERFKQQQEEDLLNLKKQEAIQNSEQRGKLLMELFRMKHTNVDFQTYKAWRKVGLINTINKDHKWAKFTFVELIWLQILETMRLLGCPYKLMQKVEYLLFTSAFEENLALKTLQQRVSQLLATSEIRKLINEERSQLKTLQNILKDPLLLSSLRQEISYLYLYIVKCIEGNQVSIIIQPETKTKQCTIHIDDENNSEVHLNNYKNTPHFKLPIHDFISCFINDSENKNFVKELFTQDELDVILN